VLRLYEYPARLIDGAAMNKKHPETFCIPSMEEKRALLVGDFVKIGAMTEKDVDGFMAERFWVRITEMAQHQGNVSFTGVVDNDLIGSSHGLKCEDRVFFKRRHVLCIMKAGTKDVRAKLAGYQLLIEG
jgi:hypothetical protein